MKNFADNEGTFFDVFFNGKKIKVLLGTIAEFFRDNVILFFY